MHDAAGQLAGWLAAAIGVAQECSCLPFHLTFCPDSHGCMAPSSCRAGSVAAVLEVPHTRLQPGLARHDHRWALLCCVRRFCFITKCGGWAVCVMMQFKCGYLLSCQAQPLVPGACCAACCTSRRMAWCVSKFDVQSYPFKTGFCSCIHVNTNFSRNASVLQPTQRRPAATQPSPSLAPSPPPAAPPRQQQQQQQQAALQQPPPWAPPQLTPELIAQHGAFAPLMCGAPPEQVRCH